jgi:tetratricopeptide (TPR) repeat protein
MFRSRNLAIPLALFFCFSAPLHAQLGKTILVPAGSDADHQLNEIGAAADPVQKLKLIDAFAAAHSEPDLQILADEQYVNYYLNTKQYDKAYDYGTKLYALDPDNFSNAVNMVRAANEQGDTVRLFSEGEKAGAILQRFKAQPTPAGTDPGNWKVQQQQKLDAVKDNQEYIEGSLVNAAYHQKDAATQAALLVRYAKMFPDSPRSIQAMDSAALLYQQAQDHPRMLETANAVLGKDPDNLGMLVLLADDYSEKGENLDKAEAYAKKAAALSDTAKKPENVSDADWQKQIALQKGLAWSALGQTGLQKKDNAGAVDSLTKAAPLLKSANATMYARNQYRLGFAYLNLKKAAEARQAFADAASVDSPYKQAALDKLKTIPATAGKPGAKKHS